jgi:hypothetical protein
MSWVDSSKAYRFLSEPIPSFVIFGYFKDDGILLSLMIERRLEMQVFWLVIALFAFFLCFTGVGAVIGFPLILFCLYKIIKLDKEDKLVTAAAPRIMECANCGFMATSTKWDAGGGCPQCGGDVYV